MVHSMEDNNSKKLFSAVLLAVGTLFVVIAGGIFVSTTWQYLPEPVKKLCLAVVTAGCFAGSYLAEKKWKLRKTSFSLYYLGVCFLGYTSYSFLRLFGLNSLRSALLMVAIMAIPVALHFWKQINVLDFILEIGLADSAVILMMVIYAEHTSYVGDYLALSVSVVTLLLSAAVYCSKRFLPGEKSLPFAGCMAIGLHSLITLPFLLQNIGNNNFVFGVLPSLLTVLSITALYVAYDKNTVLRVLQSLSVTFGSWVTVFYFFSLYSSAKDSDVNHSAVLLLTLILSLIYMVVLDRVELYIENGVFVSVAALFQMFAYLAEGADRGDDRFFYPYVFCLVIGLAAARVLKKTGCAAMCRTKVMLIWALYGFNNLLAFASVEYCTRFSAWMWFSITMYLLALLCRNYPIIREIWKTLSMMFALCGLASGTYEYLVFYESDQVTVYLNFVTEYLCAIAAVGVVLLGVIWYDVCKEIRIAQFVCSCTLLFVLLMSNMAQESLPNVLLLATVSLVILVVSTMLHKKNYAIASAVTLILIVLYLTRTFWLSIAWWVYLFAAGVGLILYAIKREKAE